ncbi:MAG: hypothetical protein QM666_00805 [Acinetobacter sp.]
MQAKHACTFLIYLFLLVGCYQPSENAVHEQKANVVETRKKSSCDELTEMMQKINNQSRIEDLQQVNDLLKRCLPHITFAQQTQLIYTSTTMYQRFLATDRTPEQQTAFEQYAVNNSTNPSMRQDYLAQFNVRDQYLIQHQGEAFYELFDAGDGTIMYRRQPNYLLQIFAPHLPIAEKVFIENLAKQNQVAIISNNNLDLSWAEISRRAQFWQNYIQQYPNSSFFDDAQRLKFKYSQFLFHGLNSLPISTDYMGEIDIYPDALAEIKRLAQGQSTLSTQAAKFLQFIELTPEQRNATIPVELSNAEKRSEQQNAIRTSKQLDAYMKLYDPLSVDSTHIARDCLIDAICITHAGKVANSLIGQQQF